jgi:hypothetical protein
MWSLIQPGVASIMTQPFALTHKGTLETITRVWGSSLTWTIQRERAGQIVRGMQPFFASSGFCLLGIKCMCLMEMVLQ